MLPFGGIDIYESKFVDPGNVLFVSPEDGSPLWRGGLYIAPGRMWDDIKFPLFLSHQRKLAREHLDSVVKAANKRLFG